MILKVSDTVDSPAPCADTAAARERRAKVSFILVLGCEAKGGVNKARLKRVRITQSSQKASDNEDR